MAFEIREFTCPECGSHEFEQNEASGLLCHGYTAKGHCTFRCAADDPRYFAGSVPIADFLLKYDVKG